MDTSDVLLAARDVLREDGWTRGSFTDSSGAHCLDGAVLEAMMQGEWVSLFPPAWTCISEEGLRRFGVRGVVQINDHHITDLDEACDVLEAAAKRAAEEGS